MKKAIIVGASSGMGNEVARLLLQEGWFVALAARRTEPLEQLAKEFPTQTCVNSIDVNDEKAPLTLRALFEAMHGADLYFHAAGIGKQNPNLEPEIELNTVETNALGFVRMIDEAFRLMASQGGGHIAAISSIAGTKGLGPAPSYSATKALQNTYIQALEQLANARKLNIRFTDIRPGFVSTPLLSGNHYPMLMQTTAVARQIVKAIHQKRHIAVIDWRYRLLVPLWRLIPNALWRHVNLLKKTKN